MANEIYKTTWWGYSDINGFGSIYATYGENPILTAYKERIDLDGGTFEGSTCLDNFINTI